jgi:DNA polymerase-3 subunit gamma/tau
LKDALIWIKDFDANAGNFRILIERLLAELHNQLLVKSGIEVETEVKLALSLAQITKLTKLLNEAYAQMRGTPIESLPLEIAIVEFYNNKQ